MAEPNSDRNAIAIRPDAKSDRTRANFQSKMIKISIDVGQHWRVKFQSVLTKFQSGSASNRTAALASWRQQCRGRNEMGTMRRARVTRGKMHKWSYIYNRNNFYNEKNDQLTWLILSTLSINGFRLDYLTLHV